MKKNRRNNSRPAAITTARYNKGNRDKSRRIERSRRCEERGKDKLLSSVYGKRNQHRGDYTESTRSMENFGEKCRWDQNAECIFETGRSSSLLRDQWRNNWKSSNLM